jgi:hypothetical protein
MGFANRAILAGVAGLAAAGLVGCGSGGSLLNSSQANQLNGQLDAISAADSDGQCVVAANAIANFRTEVANLGAVNSTLVDMLNQGVSKVAALSDRACGGQGSTTTTQTTTKTNTTTTSTGSTASATTTTTTAVTTSTTAATTTATTPPVSGTTPTSPSGGAGIGGGGAGVGNSGNSGDSGGGNNGGQGP